MSYDRAITVFSPDGHLFQVEYALEAVKRGGVSIAVLGKDEIILGVEKKTLSSLQNERTIRKLIKIDDHIHLAFSGLTADSRILIDKARVHCQSWRLAYEEPISIEQCARFIAQTQQKFTQRGGRRPFGLSTLVTGFDVDGQPRLFMTEPSGTYTEWKATAIGRSYQSVINFMEQLYYGEPPLKDSERDKAKPLSLVSSVEQLNQIQNNIDALEVAVRVLSEIAENEEQSMQVIRIKYNSSNRTNIVENISNEQLVPIITQWKAFKEDAQKAGKSYESIVLDSETA